MTNGNEDTRIAVKLALLEERQEREGVRLETIEQRQTAIEKKVQTGQVTLIVLAGIGGFIGWLATFLDKIRSWFH